MPRDDQIINDVERRQPRRWLAIDDDYSDGWRYCEDHVVVTDPARGLMVGEVLEQLRVAQQRFAA